MACIYGLRALIYMASKKSPPSFVNIREISEELDISFHFLTKTFQSLTQENVLKSYRGPSGGIAFARPPEEILLIDIVYILEGRDFFSSCLLGLPGCGEEAPCPVHDFWKEVKSAMREEFETTSLADLAAKVSKDRLRIGKCFE
ncbi:MAG: putative HTH-type transcriptional regulator [Haliscomenobacter sp.]|jgi:Rrf2 family iron-sulfur cluster assembly transcriptional regulator|nr:putative HTH-type transcriptional regulator [Haliscomenobacter sp.]